MNQKNEILDFLMNNQIENINIINFIERYPIHHIERIGDSVLVKGTSDRDWVYVSSKSEEELKIIKSRLKEKDKNFAIIEEWMTAILTEGNKIKWKLATIRLILQRNKVIDKPKQTMSKLAVKDAKFIYENSDYKDFLSIEYVTERIRNGISSCVRYMGKPIAWGITQDDGAMGFLHVLPEYRKQGYARDVTVDMIKKVREQNKIPFVHIEEHNEKSMNLALGMGFEKDRVISWFEIE